MNESESGNGFPFTRFMSLFNWDHHKEIHTVLQKWRKALKDEDSENLESASGKMIFDFNKMEPRKIYADLVLLINHGAMNCSMRELARFIVKWSNLGTSEDGVYMNLKRYKKVFK